MRSKVERHTEEAEKAVRDIRRATRRQYSAEEKVRIVIAGLRGEDSVAELCCKEGINSDSFSSRQCAENANATREPIRISTKASRETSALRT